MSVFVFKLAHVASQKLHEDFEESDMLSADCMKDSFFNSNHTFHQNCQHFDCSLLSMVITFTGTCFTKEQSKAIFNNGRWPYMQTMQPLVQTKEQLLWLHRRGLDLTLKPWEAYLIEQLVKLVHAWPILEAISTVCEQPALIVYHSLNLHEIVHFV